MRQLRHDSPLAWRYVFNAAPSLAYRVHHPAITEQHAALVESLNADGIAITSFDELFREPRLLDELATTAEAAVRSGGHAAEKDFLWYVLGDTPHLEPDSVYGRVALHRNLRAVADAYFGMYTQLRFYNVWLTTPTGAPQSSSQLWHRDREDFLILKLFVYLRDTGANAGPFRYVRGTHRKGSLQVSPDSRLEGHVERSTDEQVERCAPRDRWVEATGPRGTVILADTRGLHCGGRALTDERLLFTCMYTSRDSQVREWFVRNGLRAPSEPDVQFAVGAGRRGPRWPRRGPG